MTSPNRLTPPAPPSARAALISSDTTIPVLGSGATGNLAGMYATYTQLQTQVFVEAMDGLYMVTAVITTVGVGLAFFLRSGPAPKASGEGVHVDVG